ncbi:MAG: PEP/pyruvate-binding domain-containing protein [Candidatus Nanohaloarchaea archaeon]
MKSVLWFGEIDADDTSRVGGKSANLGELKNEVEVPVLPGFATTSDAYDKFIHDTELRDKIERLLNGLDTDDVTELQNRGEKIRAHIKEAEMPKELREDFIEAYEGLEERLGVENPNVAVRSSATAEDLPGASFAGQQDTYLNVSGKKDLIKRIKDCFASLFTNRAISYREDKGFSHFDVKLSAVVQKMGRSDIGAAGVMFTLDPDSGFDDVVTINGSYGLGDMVVAGEVNPDEFTVYKRNLGIIEKKLGDKEVKLVKNEDHQQEDGMENKEVKVPKDEREKFCITDNQVKELARYGIQIEDHYGKPMDIEWVYDGQTKEMYIVQARPETVQAEKDENIIEEYELEEESEVILEGEAIGSKIGKGKAHVLNSPKQIDQFEEGEVLVTDMTDPDWEPIMKKAGAIITNKGGRTCFTGDTKILTSEGFMTMAEAHQRFQDGEDFKLLSYDYESKEPAWKEIKESSVTELEAIEISCSQTGRATKNTIGLTKDHRMYTYDGRELVKKEIQDILEEDEHVSLIDNLPEGSKKAEDLAYLAGVVISDGHTFSNERRGGVTITQKKTDHKSQFIETVKSKFEDLFSYTLKEQEKISSGRFKSEQRTVEGVATDFRCHRRDIADIFIEIEESLDEWVTELDRESSKEFLTGLLDGDGSINENRLHIYIEKDHILRGAVLACLKLGIVPQVTTNREIWNLQIVEKQEELVEACERIDGETGEKKLSPKLFSANQLLGDVVNQVNHEGKIKPYVQKNLLLGEDKIRKRVLPLASEELEEKLETVLNSNIRMYRVSKQEELGEKKVYNFEVDEEEEMEKNYIVFTSHYTPLLVSNSHAAIVSREIGVPAVIGTENATSRLKDGQEVTVDCSSSTGKIWKGELEYNVDEHQLDSIPDTETDVQVNIGEPSEVFHVAQLPVDGVGLAREEFIISSHVGEHPLHLIEEDREEEYVQALRDGLGKIGAAFYPDQVVVRLSDFKSDEYAQLEGGEEYEPEEANPMLGFRGASRYYDKVFSRAFELECKALRKAIDELELDNLTIMVPFCRTVEEGKNVRAKMKEYGLDEGDIDVYVMAEIPANIIRAEEFAEVFDGFSIGTNDLTQLTLGVDRNSDKLKELFDERDSAVKESIRKLIQRAHSKDRHVGICGDAPSTHEGYAEFLVDNRIDAISVSPDVALETIIKVSEAEEQREESPKFEFEVEGMIGKSAGKVYEALESHGKTTAEKLKDYTPKTVDSDALNQALGWLAKEDKVKIENEEGQVKFTLNK